MDTNDLQFIDLGRRDHRRAFSLAELIVSMGILVLMLALTGQVMDFTVQATGQARALTEVNQSLRVFEQTLREDLRNIQPGDTVLLIQGNPINAYWTQAGKDADTDADPSNGYGHVRDPERENPADPNLMSPPRADVLMFFTHRRAANYVQYKYRVPNLEPTITSGVQQVVYGHADPVEFGTNGTLAADDPYGYDIVAAYSDDPAAPFPIPASRWHLARRMVHLLPLQSDPPPFAVGGPAWGSAIDNRLNGADEDDGDHEIDLLGNHAFLTGKTDVIAGYDFEKSVLTPSPASPPPFDWPEVLMSTDYPPFARSRLDSTPPPLYADRLGHYFLPNCASFKVEWALDPNSELVSGQLDADCDERGLYWIDPGAEDPLEAFETKAIAPSTPQACADAIDLGLLGSPLVPASDGWYTLRQRFGGGSHFTPDPWHEHHYAADEPRPNVVVFTATRIDADTGEVIPAELFPVALRITIDLFDENSRLDRPVRHVLVVPLARG